MTPSSQGEKLPPRRSKRLRKESSDELCIEELFPDDMGYDADIEVLQPDTYEEPESESESLVTPKKGFHTIDEELAAKMKHLGHERSGTNSPQTEQVSRGRKRRSLHEEVMQSRRGRTSDLEVVELLERSNPSPPKKRRKRSRLGCSSCKANLPQGHDIHNGQDIKLARKETQDVMDTT